jgi:hypothetical protein
MTSVIHRIYLLTRRIGELGVSSGQDFPCDADRTDGLIVTSEYGIRRKEMIPHLAGSSVSVRGTCLAGEPPWLYFGFAVPDRTGGQIKESAARSRYGLGPRGVCVP